MYCKNCRSEIKENEKFCGKCGTKVDDNVLNSSTDTDIDTNKINNKEPIKIKFTYLVIGIIIILFLLAMVVALINGSKSVLTSASEINTVNDQNSKKSKSNGTSHSNKMKTDSKWQTKVENQKVFNIDYDEFVDKCKNKLEILSNMKVDKTKNGVVYGGEIAYPKDWLVVNGEKLTNYVYGELTFREIALGRMIFIEEYQGKVKGITYLKETNSLPDTIAEQTILELLESYDIYIDELDGQLNKTSTDYDNAYVSIGKFEGGIAYARLNADASYAADAYRRSGSFGYIPYEYNKKEKGQYITLIIK